MPFDFKKLNLEKMNLEYILAIVVIVILVVVFWFWMKNKKEHLENVSNQKQPLAQVIPQQVVSEEPAHATEKKVEDIPIQPQIYDSGSGTIMAGPEYVPSQFLSPWYQAYTGNMKNYYLLDDGEDGAAGLQYNMCSKACCGDQYPLPFKMPVESAVCDNKQEFVPNTYMCNNAWQDSGCVCMTKEQSKFLGNRGGNA